MPASTRKEPADNPIVEATWDGPPVYAPRMGGLVKTGDTILVTAEQADDPSTPCTRVKRTAKTKES